MVSRVVVGAHYGLRDWLIQRVTAGVMALGCLSLAIYLALHPGLDYQGWRALFSGDAVRTFALLFMLCLYYHAWIGVRDIAMDYIKPVWLRLLIHVFVILTLIVYAIWSVQILWGY